mmetsp:Transcript_64511/g.154066  ORF Transcript_64511/g.154066 Transcript_64511/m.154066 type:complete len:342 (-) Transcript_64511:987-2012(-)
MTSISMPINIKSLSDELLDANKGQCNNTARPRTWSRWDKGGGVSPLAAWSLPHNFNPARKAFLTAVLKLSAAMSASQTLLKTAWSPSASTRNRRSPGKQKEVFSSAGTEKTAAKHLCSSATPSLLKVAAVVRPRSVSTSIPANFAALHTPAMARQVNVTELFRPCKPGSVALKLGCKTKSMLLSWLRALRHLPDKVRGSSSKSSTVSPLDSGAMHLSLALTAFVRFSGCSSFTSAMAPSVRLRMTGAVTDNCERSAGFSSQGLLDSSSAMEWSGPAAIPVTMCRLGNETFRRGDELLLIDVSHPSCPSSFLPHVRSCPSQLRRRVCEAPRATALHLHSPDK